MDCVLSPRPPPPPPLPSHLRGVSRYGAKLRSWDRYGRGPAGGQRHRRRPRADRDTVCALLPDSPSPVRRAANSAANTTQAKSNIRLAKIYAQTNLAASSEQPQPPSSPRALVHSSCPWYSETSTTDRIKEVKTLFASRAAERTAANKNYLVHLNEYVRAISKGGSGPMIIRNQLREQEPGPSGSPAGSLGLPGPAEIPDGQVQGRLSRRKQRAEASRTAHRKDASRLVTQAQTFCTTLCTIMYFSYSLKDFYTQSLPHFYIFKIWVKWFMHFFIAGKVDPYGTGAGGKSKLISKIYC